MIKHNDAIVFAMTNAQCCVKHAQLLATQTRNHKQLTQIEIRIFLHLFGKCVVKYSGNAFASTKGMLVIKVIPSVVVLTEVDDMMKAITTKIKLTR